MPVLSFVKKTGVQQDLDGLVRRGWITKKAAADIAAAKDVTATLAGLVKSGAVTEPIARTIARRAQEDAEKNKTYDTVIAKHVANVTAKTKEDR